MQINLQHDYVENISVDTAARMLRVAHAIG